MREIKLYGNQGAFPGSGKLKPEDERVRKLERENEVLRRERDILKSASHLLLTIEQKYVFIQANVKTWTVEEMARSLEVSRSGYYSYCRRKPSAW